MPGPRRVTYGGAVHSRLTDLGVAAIPLVLGAVGPGAHGAGWSLPLSAAMSVALYWRRRFPLPVLLACFLLGLTQLTAALAGGVIDRASGFLLKDTGARNLIDGVRIVHSGDAVVAPSTTRRLLARLPRRRPSGLDPAGRPGPPRDQGREQAPRGPRAAR